MMLHGILAEVVHTGCLIERAGFYKVRALGTSHFNNDEDFLKAHPYLGVDDEMHFIGCPLLEFGALEPNSGDVFFHIY